MIEAEVGGERTRFYASPPWMTTVFAVREGAYGAWICLPYLNASVVRGGVYEARKYIWCVNLSAVLESVCRA
jgi:hypothetical protein